MSGSVPDAPTAETPSRWIEQVARDKGVAITLGKGQEMRDIVGYGVMRTPGVVTDGKVVRGGVPTRERVRSPG